jgi:hypothetical protein
LRRLVGDLGHESGHAGQDEQEQDYRADADGLPVDLVRVGEALVGEHGRGEQGGGGEHGEAAPGEADGAVRRHLGHGAHGRVQRGGAPQHVGQQPTGVHDTAVVATEHVDRGVGDISGQRQAERGAYEPVAGGARRGW